MTAPAQIDQVESQIARDVARRALLVTPVVALGVGLWRGPDAALAVIAAVALVVANLLASAALLGWAARVHPGAMQAVALGSFLGRIIVITVIGVGVKALDVVDWPVFCIALVVSYFGLLIWELRYVSTSMASPGLKPKPVRGEEKR
jgi:hypothetical protein